MAGSTQIMPHDLPPFEEASMGRSTLDETEKNLLLKAIREAGGNKYKAAKALGIPRSSIYSKLKKFGLM
jgi:transcriptional regulator of acetoin/glycerol metabolism